MRNANLNKCIVFFVVALNGQNRISWGSCTYAHFNHFTVEEIGKILFVDIGGNAADVQTTRLTGQVGVSADTHPETLDWKWGR